MSDQKFSVRHEPQQSRYVLLDREEAAGQTRVIGQEAYLDFRPSEPGATTERILFHTEVDEDYGGQGLASLLVETAVTEAIDAQHVVVPVCPYVAAWLRKHPQYAEHVVPARAEHIDAVTAHRQR